MRATVTPILNFLEGSKQFVIPIYQRKYSWEKQQCQRLWDDILRIGINSESSSHFFGSIVYMDPEEPQNVGSVRQAIIIDGQQRLATLSLLISALCRTLEEKQDIDIGITSTKLSNLYLFNESETAEERYKQLLSPGDKETLIHILQNRDLPSTPSLLLEKNFRFFLSELKDARPEIVYRGIQRLKIVEIILSRNEDNPQLIFENLNSAGLDLSHADLIRNYILMGQTLEFQTELYERYWFPIEERFRRKENWRGKSNRQFDRFMRDFLTLRTRRIPPISGIYQHFKNYVPDEKSREKIEGIIEDIHRHAKHYVDIALPDEEDSELRECLDDLYELRAEVSYPFLMEIYEDYVQKRLEKSDVIKILRLVESYVFRRSICDIPSPALSPVFRDLMVNVDKDSYLESLNEVFVELQGSKRYPRNREFRNSFTNKNVYNFDRKNYLLRRLENHKSKDPIQIGKRTIEHVMPQTLSEEWKQELGENYSQVHEIYLHRIGNLTLTGYNPELSNRPFKEKRDMLNEGLRYSPLYLNHTFQYTERWDEAAIIARGQRFAERACEIWIYPDR